MGRGLLTVALAVLALAPVARADDRGTFSLASTASTARWSGSFTAGAIPAAPPAQACASTPACDVVTLHVKLPPRTWTGNPGGMLVSIQWPYIDGGYDLDLHLIGPDGNEVATSDTTIFSRNEGVWVADPKAGTYEVVVAPRLVWAVPRDLAGQLGDPKLGPL